jgi:hypothetical protein
MSNSPGKCEKSQANYFLSYILRELKKWGAKIEEKWGAFLDFSQYIAKKIIRLGFFAFPRRITHMVTG